MEEKKAKEDQAPTGGGEVSRVRVGVGEGDREVGRVRVGVGEGVGKLAGYVLGVRKGDWERGRVLDGGLSLFLVLGDQQQLVALVKPEGTVGDEELVVAFDEHD